MGKQKKPIIGYRHFMYLYMGEGFTADYLGAIEIGGEDAWQGMLEGSGTLNLNLPQLFGGDKKEGGVVGTLKVRQGEATQMPDPYLQAQVPGPWPAARGLCTTLFDGQVGSMNPYVKQWSKRWGGFTAGWTTPVWQPDLCKIDRGKNPAHILYQAFTDTQRGLGFSTTLINDATWVPTAQKLFDESFGLCLMYRAGQQANNWINMILDHIGGEWSQDPRTGMIDLNLYRPGYDVDELPVIDPSMIVSVESWQTATLDNTVNEVTAVGRDCITNKDISVTAHNLANIQAQGRVLPDKRQFPGLWNRSLLKRVAEREALIASSLLTRIKLVLKADLWGIKRGEVRALTFPKKGWLKVPVRVLEVDEGTRTDSRITVTLLQDINGMVDVSYLGDSISVWTPPDTTPKPVPAQLAYEATRRDLAGYLSAGELAAIDDDSGYLVAVAAQPTGQSFGFDLHTRTGTAAFVERGSGEFSPNGVLLASIDGDDTTITIDDGVDLDAVELGSEMILGSERCRVVALNPVTGAATIGRGCIDTVPVAQIAGTRVWFPDGTAGSDATVYLTGETVNAKLLTRTIKGTLDPILASVVSVEMDQRQARPYPPGKVRVDGTAWPSAIEGVFNVTWTHRDRLLQADQLVDHEQNSVGPEETTRYGLRFLDAGTVLVERDDIDGNTATVELDFTGTVTMELYSLSDRGDSWQRHERTFAYAADVGTTESTIDAPTWTPIVRVIDGGEVTP